MTEVNELQSYIISNYTRRILYTKIENLHNGVKINEQAIINSLKYNLRFYTSYIAEA